MAQQEYHGVYMPGSDGEPVVLFKDADAAQRFRQSTYGADAGLVAPVKVNVSKDEEIARALAPNPPTPTVDPDAELRMQVRARLEQEAREKRIEAEVRKEMAEAQKDSK